MKKATYFFATMLIFLSSCAVYYPQPIDIPLISEKGDLRIDAGGFIVPGALGGHSTISYGITDILAAQMYASFDLAGGVHLQFAPGLFKHFENDVVIELYSGYGIGNTIINSFASAFGHRVGYQLAFSQFNIGQVRANFDYGFGLKGGYAFGFDEIFDHETNRRLIRKNGWLVEPSAMIRFGSERVRYKAQVGFLWTQTKPVQNYLPLSLSFGVNINLNTRTSKTPRITNFD